MLFPFILPFTDVSGYFLRPWSQFIFNALPVNCKWGTNVGVIPCNGKLKASFSVLSMGFVQR